jgi:hypothetical protein
MKKVLRGKVGPVTPPSLQAAVMPLDRVIHRSAIVRRRGWVPKSVSGGCHASSPCVGRGLRQKYRLHDWKLPGSQLLRRVGWSCHEHSSPRGFGIR